MRNRQATREEQVVLNTLPADGTAIYENSEYVAAVGATRFDPAGPVWTRLFVWRHDNKPLHSWADLQHIKNHICGEGSEAVELNPAEAQGRQGERHPPMGAARTRAALAWNGWRRPRTRAVALVDVRGTPSMSRHRPTIGLALIAFNEEHDLPRLLDSIDGAFDQVVRVGSHSTDATVDVFREWCERTKQRHVVDQFEWIEDFSAKRNHANGLPSTDWACWADCDDTIENARRLRRIARRTPADIAALAFDYQYMFLENGECITTFARTRLVRRGAGVWVGRTHDVQIIANEAIAYSNRARWVHHDMDSLDTSHERDKRILERWHAGEPDNHLATAALDAYGTYPGFDLAMCAALEAETATVAAALEWRDIPHAA